MTQVKEIFGGAAVMEEDAPLRATLTDILGQEDEPQHVYEPLDLSEPEPFYVFPTDPKLIADRARSVLDISKKTGLPTSMVEQNHNGLKGEIDQINKTWTEVQKNNEPTLREWKPGLWERMLRYVYSPEPAGGWDRSDKPFRSLPPAVAKEAGQLSKRFGKKIANSFAEIGETIISSPLSPVGLPNKDVEPYMGQALKEIEASGFSGNVAQKHMLARTRAATLAAQAAVPGFEVKPADGGLEKGVDIVAGLTAFISQLVITKRVLPAGTPAPVVWEVQNQLSNGVPGQGAVMATTLGAIGKIPVRLPFKVAAQSTIFASLTAQTGGEKEDIAVAALVPVVFAAVGMVKGKHQALRAGKEAAKVRQELVGRSPKMKSYIESLSDAQILSFRNAINDAVNVANGKMSEGQWRDAHLKFVTAVGRDATEFFSKQPAQGSQTAEDVMTALARHNPVVGKAAATPKDPLTAYPRETQNMMQRYNASIKRAQSMGDYEMVEAFKAMERMELTNIEKRAQAEAGQKPALPEGKKAAKAITDTEAPVGPTEVQVSKVEHQVVPEGDEGGILYHGSPVAGLTEVKPSRGDYGYGVYLASEDVARKHYAPGRKKVAAYVLGDTAQKPSAGNVYVVEPDIENPLIVANQQQYEQLLDEHGDSDKGIGTWAKEQGYDAILNHHTGEHIVFTDTPIPVAEPTQSPGDTEIVEPGAEKQVAGVAEITSEGIVSLPTDQIKADPDKFQFKLDATAEGGVSEKLGSVSEWNERSAGTVLVWQNKAGELYVVDGHHRVNLAKKLGVEKVNAFVVRESDGFTESDARVMGAMSNLADEKGTAIDAAKVFRESDIDLDALRDEGVDTKSALVRQGLAMKNLSDEVFRMVIDGKVPATMAAQIGKHVKDPVQQKQVAQMIADGQVDSAREAELLAKTIDSAPILSKTEQTLFGTETTTKSLYAERAKVLANVERILKTNKKVFGTLSQKAGIIEEAGNVLNKDANLQAKQQADETLFLLEKLANSKGPVSEALNEATKQYAENPTKQKLSEVTQGLLGRWQKELTVENVGKVRPGLSESPGKPEEGLFGGKQAGFVNVEPVLKAHETFMKILEPSKAVEKKLGKETYAAVIKGIHNPDVAQIEFTEAELTGHDKTIGQMREWFSKFSDTDLRNLMKSRGDPVGDIARLIQQDALNALPEELQGKAATNAIDQIANFNYAKLQQVVGEDVNKVKDYFYGIYEEPDKVDAFIEHWKTTKRFTKEKKLPTVADAAAYGLKLRHANPVDNLKAEYMGIARLEGMTWMRDEFIRTGKGIFIDELIEATPEMTGVIQDPVFKKYRTTPELADLVNNLIAKNKITAQPQLNALREANNFIRTVKFMGSAFHLLSVAKQSVADSGYLGFLYKKTAYRGLTTGFRDSDPIFKTEAYKDYVAHGGGHRYSVESEAERTFNNAVSELNKAVGAGLKAGLLPVKIPAGFVKWMFQSYIPKVKYSKYLDVVAEQSKKLGRPLKASEKIDIIKEQQNFYGMMNERLFGRSGTVTSALRFWFMSPGYAEGNYRTMLKAATQWGQQQEAELLKGLPGAKEPGFSASRSRSNIVNSLIISGIVATVGTMIRTGKAPKKPETLDDLRDLWKIDTGKKDEKGQRIMIDMLTYDKDYWNVVMNTARLRPDKALAESWRRIGGMKAPTAKVIADLAMMATGEAIYDWKGDRVVEITDPFLRKAMKLAAHEVKELSPISVSVFTQARRRDLDTTTAAIGTLMGVRPTKSEKAKRDQHIISKIYSLRGQQEEMYLYLGSIKNPREAVERYNKTVQDILNYKYVTPELRKEWDKKLTVDVDRLLENKAYSLGAVDMDDSDRDRIVKYLNNFGVTKADFSKLLDSYKNRPKKDQPFRPLDKHPVIGPQRRRKRAIERYEEKK